MTTQALHTERINLSPFTKDFRVWGATIAIAHISFRLSSDGFLSKLSLVLGFGFWPNEKKL